MRKNAPIDTEIPDYTQIEDHIEAKETMKTYLTEVMEQAKKHGGKATEKAIDEAEKVLSDEKFILQKGQRSLSDPDARVGSKSKTESFFGYKAEFTMTADERIITAMTVSSGEYVDGTEFERLLEATEQEGIKVEEFYGDRAYFRKNFMESLNDRNIRDYIPVSASVYKMDEEKFSYNKDSDFVSYRFRLLSTSSISSFSSSPSRIRLAATTRRSSSFSTQVTRISS